ncbi:molecular chaperone TorD family protein [uncultured Campylobacter sp.]|uniref:molecular chaperone TorD family protein n=1 Tax=uncultured Campylobacter sp. TaxID=218934 RepID=UPI00260B661D|nr:molecular chaperone TorD family protein [uncultured Campylobacter sp.]
MDANLLQARSYYYEFFAIPFFFYETDAKFKRWKEQLEFLRSSPIVPSDEAEFQNLAKFDFAAFKSEQNSVLFDFSYANVPMSASFYDEGRDDGRMRVAVIDALKKSKFRRNMELCKECEDYVGFIFYLHSTLLRDAAAKHSAVLNGQNSVANEQNFTNSASLTAQDGEALALELFTNVTNSFVDEFSELLCGHVRADFFKSLGALMRSFFALERSLLALAAPQKKDRSVVKEAIKKGGYQNKFTNPEDIFDLD